MVSNQWDYPPLRRNQTHSLIRRLELPAFALTFLRVPAFFFLNPNTREGGKKRRKEGGDWLNTACTWESVRFFSFLRDAWWLIYEEDTFGMRTQTRSVSAERSAWEKRTAVRPLPRTEKDSSPPRPWHLPAESQRKDNITPETKNTESDVTIRLLAGDWLTVRL